MRFDLSQSSADIRILNNIDINTTYPNILAVDHTLVGNSLILATDHSVYLYKSFAITYLFENTGLGAF